MKVIPRQTDNGFEAHQFTVEAREFVVRWTGGVFHGDADPRKWALLIHTGNGVAREAHLGNWIVRHVGHFDILTSDEFDRRYKRLDRPGNDVPANAPLTSSVRECGCTVSDGWRCPVHGSP